MESETMALAESADAGNFVALITKQISGMNTALRLFCKTNKKSLEEHLKSSKRNTRPQAYSGYCKASRDG